MARASLIVFFFCRVIKSEITKIHLNLSIAVGVAQVLFLAAGSENLVQREVSESPYLPVNDRVGQLYVCATC